MKEERDPFQGGLAIGRAATLQTVPSVRPAQEPGLTPAGDQTRTGSPIECPECSCFHGAQDNPGGRSNSGVGSEKFLRAAGERLCHGQGTLEGARARTSRDRDCERMEFTPRDGPWDDSAVCLPRVSGTGVPPARQPMLWSGDRAGSGVSEAIRSERDDSRECAPGKVQCRWDGRVDDKGGELRG